MWTIGRLYGRAALMAALALCIAEGVAPAAGAGLSRRYEYQVSWNSIPAARATVRLTQQAALATTEMRVEIETNRFVDLFWSLRAEGWGQVDAATLRPQRFEFDRRIDGVRELTRVEAEPDGRLTGRYMRGSRFRQSSVTGTEMLDPISAVLRALRDLPADGHPDTYEIFTGEARYRIVLRHQASEAIAVPAGRFTAAHIEPLIWRVDRNDRERRVSRVSLWVTETAPHVLLRVRGEVFIGALYCELTEMSADVAPGGDRASLAESQAQLQ
jgi:hypothetical protein